MKDKVRYWYKNIGRDEIKQACVDWFGWVCFLQDGSDIEAIREICREYPTPTKDEAIETAILIYTNRNK